MPQVADGFLPRTQSEWATRIADRLGGRLGIVIPLENQDDPLTRLVTGLAEDFAEMDLQIAGSYDAWNPRTARRAQLDRVLAAFGTMRRPESSSEARVRVVGTPTLDLSGRLVTDADGALWVLPATVVGALGNVDVTATAQDPGPLVPALGSWSLSGTQPAGLVSITGLQTLTVGASAEEDPIARARLEELRANGDGTEPAIYSALFAVPGVDVPSLFVDVNRTNVTSAEGVPAKHVEALVLGGSADAIATALLNSAAHTEGFFGLDSGTGSFELSDGRTISEVVAFTYATSARIYAQVTIVSSGAPKPLPADFAATARGAVAAYSETLKVRDALLSGGASSRVTAALPEQTSVSVVVEFSASRFGPFSPAVSPGSRKFGRVSNAPSPGGVVGTALEPFAITAGWQLDFSADGGPTQSVIFPAFVAATAQDVADEINAAGLDGVVAYDSSGYLAIDGTTTGATKTLEIEGTSTAALLLVLGTPAAVYSGLDTDVISVVAV